MPQFAEQLVHVIGTAFALGFILARAHIAVKGGQADHTQFSHDTILAAGFKNVLSCAAILEFDLVTDQVHDPGFVARLGGFRNDG